MLEITTSGSPSLIGHQHGTLARSEIHRSIRFYTALFLLKTSMDWPTVTSFALQYQPYLKASWPEYVEEIKGVAEGARVKYEDILALNVRTELAFGKFSDGCTAVSWKEGEKSLLGQNWDWDTDQAENLILLKIEKENGMTIETVTEAGIIGKIGLNSHGVGCTLNAIKAQGVSFERLPCHLALRTVLESTSRAAAISALEKAGVASACHILVADKTGGTGLEFSSQDLVKLEMSSGVVLHTNHYVRPHADGVVEAQDWIPDTKHRLGRIGELVEDERRKGDVGTETLEKLLADEVEGDGAAICRMKGKDGLATLFSIVMDLGAVKGLLKVGRPTEATEVKTLSPGGSS